MCKKMEGKLEKFVDFDCPDSIASFIMSLETRDHLIGFKKILYNMKITGFDCLIEDSINDVLFINSSSPKVGFMLY